MDAPRNQIRTLEGRSKPAASRPLVLIFLIAGLLVGIGCGGDGADSGGSPSDAADLSQADDGDAKVILDWSSALAAGDVDAAAELFAVPSLAENGPGVIRIRSAEQAQAFNRSLPCGAVLIRAVTQGDFTTATFELTDRPGSSCGAGVGGEAQTAFVIEDGLIVEWRRVAPPDPGQGKVI